MAHIFAWAIVIDRVEKRSGPCLTPRHCTSVMKKTLAMTSFRVERTSVIIATSVRVRGGEVRGGEVRAGEVR